ncbi:hypothetical protein CONPUDRAFT_156663 [Coniophora puteana RWD-64-598 SS2]|uniref:DUF6533 domain-containing protein n=1 Tax=Coniophora puteana (strain RWD-64-598) TaxID=741705 RepID=A0A5M3MIF4_CONPW|nr:uncharacterized protein CONPUDRAFT_156663 [Coniophora puteana RWD-64-598 SS2]EIW78700.1 hypothetical protein CONPUDRAFT_156663 [Coniophora puteana RWD-64-598 SS2]
MGTLVSDASGKQYDAYANTGIAVLAFDYCITLDKEVKLVWGRKWDFGRTIFTLARYLPFPGIAMTVYAALQSVALNPCGHLDNGKFVSNTGLVSNLLHIAAIVAAEALLLIRTWVFWDKNKRLMVILCVLAVVFIVAAVLITSHVNDILSLRGTPNPWPEACDFRAGKGSAIQYAFLVVYELTVSLGNIVVTVAAANYHNEYLDSLQVTMHSVVAARLFFHLKESSSLEQSLSLPQSLEHLHDASAGGACGMVPEDMVEG